MNIPSWLNMMMQKKSLINGVLLLSSLLVSFFLLECLFRFIYAEKNVLFPRYHSQVSYGDFTIRRLEPSSKFRHTSMDGSWEFITNGKGFRSTNENFYEKKPGTIRILALGDSHTQGFEVRQEFTFSSILEGALRNRNYDVEVINSGVSGFSTAEELVFLENEGVKYDPDYVVVGFYANDYNDNIKSDLFRLENGELIINQKEYIPGIKILKWHNRFGILRWLSESSYLYSFFMNLVWDSAKTHLLKQKSDEMAVFSGSLTQYKVGLANKLIARLCEFNQTRNIKTIIVDIPRAESKLNKKYRTSLVEETEETVIKKCDGFLRSDDYLERFSGVIDPFVAHGHRHISEFTHTLIGVHLGGIIEEFEKRKMKNIKVIHNDKKPAEKLTGSDYM